MSVHPEIIEQVRAWRRKCIVASDYPRLRDELGAEPCADEQDEEDAEPEWGGYSDLLRAKVGIGFLREAANHYPHPLGGVLLDAALAEIVPHIRPWSLEGVVFQGVYRDVVDGIIKKILEEPDALLA